MKLKLSFHVVCLLVFSYFAFHFDINWQPMFSCPVLDIYIKDIVVNHSKGKEKNKANKPPTNQTLRDGRKGYLNSNLRAQREHMKRKTSLKL